MRGESPPGDPPRTGGILRAGLALSAIAALGFTAGCGGHSGATHPARDAGRGGALVTVGANPVGRPIAPGFVGLSVEYNAVRAYTGTDPRAINPVLVQLIRNLAPGQAPVLRIGGDSTDSSWWPVAGMQRPPGVTNDLSAGWLAAARGLAQSIGGSLILGVNLKADSATIAAAEAQAFLSGIGRRYIAALEIGNEPEVYGRLAWYRSSSGQRMFARPWSYGLPQYIAEFQRLRAALPQVPLAGPATGFRDQLRYTSDLLAADPQLGVVTFHRYPLNRCFTPPGSRQYPTLSNLLSPFASRGLMWGVPRYVALAHDHGVQFRVDEMNSIACGGSVGLSDAFASALWAVDTLFEMARSGVDGVNFHTFPGARYSLFQFSHRGGRWQALVHPDYYGLLLFTEAAPAGARLLPVAVTGPAGIRGWATVGPGSTEHVLLLNDDSSARTVVLRVLRAGGRATLSRLEAPSVLATKGVRLAGQSFGSSTKTGRLQGAVTTSRLSVAADRYVVRLSATSAALVTIN